MNKVLLGSVAVLVLGGLAAGFAVVGGPEYARAERHDQMRLADLRELANYQICLSEQPEDAAAGRCGGQGQDPDLTDPVTEAAYVVKHGSDHSFEVCARFETELFQDRPDRAGKLWFDGQEGCLRFARQDSQAEWLPR